MFPRASDALACAADLRSSFAAVTWHGEIELRVRIALHGRGARACRRLLRSGTQPRGAAPGLADGGATLLSRATMEIIHDRLPEGMELADLGYDCRGLSRPERIFELRREGEPGAAELPGSMREIGKTVTVLL